MLITLYEFEKLVRIEDRLNQLTRKLEKMDENDSILKDDVFGILKDMTFKEAYPYMSSKELRCLCVNELDPNADAVKISMRRFEDYIIKKEITNQICKLMIRDRFQTTKVRKIIEVYEYELISPYEKEERVNLFAELKEKEGATDAGADQEDE